MNEIVYSDWYDYKGEVDFQGPFVCVAENKDGSFVTDEVNYVHWFDAKRYRIKLDGVRVIEYEQLSGGYYIYESTNIPEHKVIGKDPHNKIIIVKE